MVDASEAEWTTIENVLVKTRQALADDDSPEATALKEQILEAEQIVSSKLDQNSSMNDSMSGPTGGARYSGDVASYPLTQSQDEDMIMMGADESTISLDDFKEIGSHLQAALNLIQSAIKPSEPPGMVPPKEAVP